ncbi:OmpA family protein [Niabella hirudinis]|uniref:OmpA family protein n=1 Tax=Niabella hirudinis TaxID=1285929 RepID=UPI003EB7C19B
MRKRNLILLLLLLQCLQYAYAQQNNTERYPDAQPSWYLGARGGYIFKNQTLAENPLYYFNSGYFAELNGGWRQKAFSWELALGTLNVQRNKASMEFNPAAADILNGLSNKAVFKNALDAGEADGQYYQMPATTRTLTLSKNYRNFYALTGPNIWLGKRRLQVNVYAQAGAALQRFGYYYVKGNGASANTFTYNYNTPTNPPVTVGKANVSIDGNYTQYAMSKAFYDDYTASGANDPDKVKEKSTVQFIARGGAGINYFVSPRVSINAGADYWHIPSPATKSVQAFDGNATGTVLMNGNATPVAFSDKTSYSKDITGPKPLRFISASLGVRIWLGRSQPTAAPTLPPPAVVPAPPVIVRKNIIIKVTDQPTGQPLKDVAVKIINEGSREAFTAVTDANGLIPAYANVRAGRYRVIGEKNGVSTTEAIITDADFRTRNTTIIKELQHNDARFTLEGKTINKQTKNLLPFIQTMLTNENKASVQQKTSDTNAAFVYLLDPNTDYTISAQHKGYFSNKEKITTKGLNRNKVMYVDLELDVMEFKQGASIVLKDIFYDFNKADIRPDAALVLDNLVKALKENATIRIELSSHTDSRGSDSYNLKLSQKRAEAAVKYLVSKGIQGNRLRAKGYGETKLVNYCADGISCTEEQHQQNRRTEIRVLE